jgi:hypothetical protein
MSTLQLIFLLHLLLAASFATFLEPPWKSPAHAGGGEADGCSEFDSVDNWAGFAESSEIPHTISWRSSLEYSDNGTLTGPAEPINLDHRGNFTSDEEDGLSSY